MPRSTASICYQNNSAIPNDVVEALEKFSLKRDGTVTTSDLLAGAHALEQLRGLNRFMKLVIGMLSVVVLILLVGSFGSTMWAISLSKETMVSGRVLVTPGGDAVRVMSNEFAVDESGLMVTRAGHGAAVATAQSGERVTSLRLVNGSVLLGAMALDRAEACRVHDRIAQGTVAPVVADWNVGDTGAGFLHATTGRVESDGGPCESSAVTMMGKAGAWEWRAECGASTGANPPACLVSYVLTSFVDSEDNSGAARQLQGRDSMVAGFNSAVRSSLDGK